MTASSRFAEELSRAYGFQRAAWIMAVSPSPMPSGAVKATVSHAPQKRCFGQTWLVLAEAARMLCLLGEACPSHGETSLCPPPPPYGQRLLLIIRFCLYVRWVLPSSSNSSPFCSLHSILHQEVRIIFSGSKADWSQNNNNNNRKFKTTTTTTQKTTSLDLHWC